MTDFHHIEDRIDDYFGEALPPVEMARFEEHLDSCPDCRKLVDNYKALFAGVATLPQEIQPDHELWDSIESRLDRRAQALPNESTSNMRLITFSLAAVAVVAFLAILYTLSLPSGISDEWEIVPVAGQPVVNAEALRAPGLIKTGHAIRTDSESSAVVEVGSIGTIDIAPSTSIDLLSTDHKDHRFRLNDGEIHATINAPPRIFFVETPSALAIDLGCEYTLHVDSAGVSRLHVQFGYVELNHPLRSSIVPEGFRAVSDPTTGPTVPFDEDASQDFVDALIEYELQENPAALESLLLNATVADATSLWLLIDRVPHEARVLLYHKIVELVGEPENVTMEGVLVDGSVEMSLAWQDFLGLDLTLMNFDGVKSTKKEEQP